MDYEALKAKKEEIQRKRDKLAEECEAYNEEINRIEEKMRQVDHTKVLLDSSQESKLRHFIQSKKEYHILNFYKYYSCLFEGDPTVYTFHTDSIIKIQSVCNHESQIITLSDHAFNICCEVLGDPKKSEKSDDLYTWLIRS